MSDQKQQRFWINNPLFDGVFILSPPFVSLLVVWLLPGVFKQTAAMPVAAWVLLVLFVDVAHVYSTLFRTYFDPVRFRRQRSLYLFIPVICYMAGVLLHGIDGMLFWRVLAYLAVFHFIRQQYGFMRLYARREQSRKAFRLIDTLTVYYATIYPLLYWHLTPGRNFNWFIDGDFLQGDAQQALSVFSWLYGLLVAVYIVKEAWQTISTGIFNLPKNLVITGTLVSWYFGIVYFNGDLAFTLLNVVSHGIPYMALIWYTARKERLPQAVKDNPVRAAVIKRYGVLLFVCMLFALAYLEEGLWDGFVWRDHGSVFAFFGALPQVTDKYLLTFLVPLLSLPQSTHYVLDAFIWRRKDG